MSIISQLTNAKYDQRMVRIIGKTEGILSYNDFLYKAKKQGVEDIPSKSFKAFYHQELGNNKYKIWLKESEIGDNSLYFVFNEKDLIPVISNNYYEKPPSNLS